MMSRTILSLALILAANFSTAAVAQFDLGKAIRGGGGVLGIPGVVAGGLPGGGGGIGHLPPPMMLPPLPVPGIVQQGPRLPPLNQIPIVGPYVPSDLNGAVGRTPAWQLNPGMPPPSMMDPAGWRVPTPSCLQWAGHPMYVQLTNGIVSRKGELEDRYRVDDAPSCRRKSKLVTDYISKNVGIVESYVASDLSRCACDGAYSY